MKLSLIDLCSIIFLHKLNNHIQTKGEIEMIQIISGEKGEGKTKKLIAMANEAGKTSNGHVVFIDDDNRHMYDLHYNIRFVKTNFQMDDQKIFFGFLCGILSQDNDIEQIYIDGLHNIVKNLESEDIADFVKGLEVLSETESVDFKLIISGSTEALPEIAKQYVL